MAKKKDDLVVAGRQLFEGFVLYRPNGKADGTGEWEFTDVTTELDSSDRYARVQVEDSILVCKIVPVRVYIRDSKTDQMVRTYLKGGTT